MGDAMDDLRPSTVYSALPFHDSFRLLELEPSTDYEAPIICRLRPSRLSDRPTYNALSYSWQSDEANAPPMSIRCNGHNMEIGSNLWHALRRLRQTDTTKVVWADALCINQADTAERNHQVRQMGAVYSGAELVVIWLGEVPPPEMGIDIAAGLLAMVAVKASWHNDSKSRGMIHVRVAAGISVPVEEVETFGGYSRRLTPREARAIVHIYQRAWFHRLWVIQEVALAKKVMVMLGKSEMSWGIVAISAQLIRTTPELAAVVEDAVEAYRAVESASKMFLMWAICEPSNNMVGGIHDLLILTRGLQCQDNRDRIFGLLALPTTDRNGMGGKIEADYGLSAGEVFRQAAIEILETADSLDLLSDCQHEVGTEPWLPGSGSHPSWVPQWHLHPHRRLLVTRWDVRYRAYNAAGFKQRELEWTTDKRPRVKGIEVVRIKQASRVLTEDCFEKSDGNSLESVFTTSSPPTGTGPSLPGTSTPLAMPEHAANLLALMLRTLSGLPDPGAERFKQYGLVLKKGFLRWSLPRVSNGGLDFLSAWDQSSWEDMPVGDYHLTIENEDNFLSWTKMVCANRRLFLTEDGEIGLGPGVMRPGDVVCVLYGMSMPVVLRRIGETYAVMGECYVDGLMMGGAVGEESEGFQFRGQFREAVERWFELV